LNHDPPPFYFVGQVSEIFGIKIIIDNHEIHPANPSNPQNPAQ